MDYTIRAEMQQNPNPYSISNSSVSLVHATTYSHTLSYDPYQPLNIDPHGALLSPQPRPPGVDQPYAPSPVTYTQQVVNYEPQQQVVDAAAVSYYYPEPNTNWAAAITQIGASHYAEGITTPNTSVQSQRRNIWQRGPKKTKVVQSAWCEVCKVDCNSKDVLNQHKVGKKHQKNLEKLKVITAPSPAIVPGPSVILAPSPAAINASIPLPATDLAPIDKPIIGPEENPEKSNASKVRKKAAARTDDLETKRRKVLGSGAAAEAVRACSICNVVCNSDTVFEYHLAGQKHASMIKKHTSNAGVASAL